MLLLSRNVAGTELPGNIPTIFSLSWKAVAFLLCLNFENARKKGKQLRAKGLQQ